MLPFLPNSLEGLIDGPSHAHRVTRLGRDLNDRTAYIRTESALPISL
jgi:hypothetical protein